MKLLVCLALIASPALADPPIIEAVTATRTGETWRFEVTLSHPDTGWDHYADGWRILDPAGTTLGTRELLHPHVNEQPFTRALDGVVIPADIAEIMIEAHDTQDGWSGQTKRFSLPE